MTFFPSGATLQFSNIEKLPPQFTTLCLSLSEKRLMAEDSFRAHTFSLREDPWPTFSFRVAYAHRIFDDATQCKFCFCIASAPACLELSSATASATFRYAGFSLRKRNSRTSPLCNFIMDVFDTAQLTASGYGGHGTRM